MFSKKIFFRFSSIIKQKVKIRKIATQNKMLIKNMGKNHMYVYKYVFIYIIHV